MNVKQILKDAEDLQRDPLKEEIAYLYDNLQKICPEAISFLLGNNNKTKEDYEKFLEDHIDNTIMKNIVSLFVYLEYKDLDLLNFDHMLGLWNVVEAYNIDLANIVRYEMEEKFSGSIECIAWSFTKEQNFDKKVKLWDYLLSIVNNLSDLQVIVEHTTDKSPERYEAEGLLEQYESSLNEAIEN